jgi:RNA polymerase sigma-70 factor, ECF subfamily
LEELNEDFIRRLKRQEHRAFARLYEIFGREIFSYIRSYFPQESETARDVQQEVFLTAYTRIGTLRDSLKIRPWLYRIAFNRCMDKKRFKKVLDRSVKEYGQSIGRKHMPSHEEGLFNREAVIAVMDEIQRLPVLLREIYILSEFQDLKYQEISELKGMSLSRVKKAMIKASCLLLDKLKKRNFRREDFFI